MGLVYSGVSFGCLQHVDMDLDCSLAEMEVECLGCWVGEPGKPCARRSDTTLELQGIDCTTQGCWNRLQSNHVMMQVNGR